MFSKSLEKIDFFYKKDTYGMEQPCHNWTGRHLNDVQIWSIIIISEEIFIFVKDAGEEWCSLACCTKLHLFQVLNIQKNVENILDISLSYSLEVQCNTILGEQVLYY